MKVQLLPRLNGLATSKITQHLSRMHIASSTSSLSVIQGLPNAISYAAVGGTRSSRLEEEIDTGLRSIAELAGFPNGVNQEKRALFDEEASKFLATLSELRTGEALRNDVWAHLSCIMLPDVVAWRFPKRDKDRYAGGSRNAFQRLWMRGLALDRGEQHASRWELLSSLTEDAMVQIFERPSIGSNLKLARALAETWLETSREIGRNNMEHVMRRATKLVRVRNQIIDLAFLPDEELRAQVSAMFSEARNVNQ